MNKSQTIDCLLTKFLIIRCVTQMSNVVGIRRLRLLWHKRIVLSFRLSFTVMKAHVNNSYIRKIHKQRNINCKKYVRKFWDLESVILLKSGCQRKPGKMLKMSTEGGQQNTLILTS